MQHQVRLSGLQVLHSLRDVVLASLAAIEGRACLAPMEAVRRLDWQIADLRLPLVPLTAGRFIMRRARADRPLTAVLACAVAGVDERIAAMLSGCTAPDNAAKISDGPAGQALLRLDLALALLSERLADNLADGFAVG